MELNRHYKKREVEMKNNINIQEAKQTTIFVKTEFLRLATQTDKIAQNFFFFIKWNYESNLFSFRCWKEFKLVEEKENNSKW